MALADPQALTYNGSAKNLPLQGRTAEEATYGLVDSGNVAYTLKVNHQFQDKSGKRKERQRAVVRLTREGLVPDPLATGQNKPESMTVTVTADWSVLHSPAEVQLLYNALLTQLTSATFLKVAGGET